MLLESFKAPGQADFGTATKAGTLVEIVYADIRRRLNLGEWRPGDRLLDYAIADEFACTRMPVRQALLRLVNDGLLITSSRGFRVPVLNAQQIREVFQLRRILEPAAAAIVARNAEPVALGQQLGLAIDIAKVAIVNLDSDIMFSSNAAFRRAWLQCVGNERLVRMIALSADHANQVRFSNTRDVSSYGYTLSELKKLASALTGGDAAIAEQTMFDFLLLAETAYFERHSKD